MAGISLDHVSKVYSGNVRALDEFNLAVGEGEFVVLVGPSGCGKTTTLRLIAGLEDATAGTIHIGERVVNRVPPKDRDIAMVFQNYALYPHMTVYHNLAFGLKMRRVPRAQVKGRVHAAANMLGIAHLLDKKPAALSGGERQRVAVGRAIVREPAAFLFDEPLSNLDAQLRLHMRAELKRLHRDLRTTAIYVTHDQEEALALGDRIVVMKDGLIQQVAAPIELHERPSNRFVAGFVGTPPMNFVDGHVRVAVGAIWFDTGEVRVRLSAAAVERLAAYDGRAAVLGARPEHVVIGGVTGAAAIGRCAGCGAQRQGPYCHACGRRHEASADGDGVSRLSARVEVIELLGDVKDIRLRTPGGLALVARVAARAEIALDAQVDVRLDVDRLHVFEPGPGGRNVGL